MTIRIRRPEALAHDRQSYCVWVDAVRPVGTLARAVDKRYGMLAPSPQLRCWRTRNPDATQTFAAYYQLELDTVDARPFDALSRQACIHDLTLVSYDHIAASILKEYLGDWLACDIQTRHRLHRCTEGDSALSWVIYTLGRSKGLSHEQAMINARGALRLSNNRVWDRT